ncbi:MAG: hypothetical protein KC766_17170 [Myxococcales bacterium]|nr:hypothetical protein [Myxococcales bacterium]
MTDSFSDYFRDFVRREGHGAPLVAHLTGTIASLLLAALMLRFGLVFFLPIALYPLLQGALIAAWLGERSTDLERPSWCLRAEFKLLWLWLSGRLARARAPRARY